MDTDKEKIWGCFLPSPDIDQIAVEANGDKWVSRYRSHEFRIYSAPVSFQSSGKKKTAIVGAIKDLTRKLEYIITGDVRVMITCHSPEQVRFEHDCMYDMDNVIKPILDGICGPEGLICDDCQVEYISNHWMDHVESEYFDVKIDYVYNEFMPKHGIVFVNIDRALCYPLLVEKRNIDVVKSLQVMHEEKNKLMSEGALYGDCYEFIPLQRVFHKSKISKFRVVTVDEFIIEASKS